MAYQGYLLKLGNYTFPHEFINKSNYKAYINMQDVDAWTDADGYLHRNAVELKALKVELETKGMITNTQFANIMSEIRVNFTVPSAKQLVITAYIPEIDDYVTQTGYMADIQPQIYGIFDGIIKYEPIRFAFVGGVYNE